MKRIQLRGGTNNTTRSYLSFAVPALGLGKHTYIRKTAKRTMPIQCLAWHASNEMGLDGGSAMSVERRERCA